MQIVRATDELKDAWNTFVGTTSSDGGFLQSWHWGDFQKSLGRQVFRIAAIDGEGSIQGVALLIKNEIHFEYNYLYSPRGPVVNSSEKDVISLLMEEIKKVAKEEKSFVIRMDPAWKVGDEKNVTNFDYRKSEKEIQPKCSLIINIEDDEDKLLAEMKQKARYNIGLAQKKGVAIRVSEEMSDIEAFWQLVKQTSSRDGFAPHAKEYYKKMFEQMAPSGVLKLYMAEYEGKIITANLVIFFGDVCVYLHGASADLYRDVMAPYSLQWFTILDAKKSDFKYYDFGGLNGETYHSDQWEGITRFKTGFSPKTKIMEFVGSYELVTNPVIFSVYKFVKQVRG